MGTLLRYAGFLVAVYLAAWTASYVGMFLIRGGALDLSHFFKYFGLAWTFRGGELPTFIWLLSVIAFLPLARLSVILLRRYKRRKNVA